MFVMLQSPTISIFSTNVNLFQVDYKLFYYYRCMRAITTYFQFHSNNVGSVRKHIQTHHAIM